MNLRSRKTWLTRVLPVVAVAAAVAGGIIAIAPTASASVPFEVESLDGSGNNVANPMWGRAGRPYPRVGTTHYADGIGQPMSGPNARYISNRIINDGNQDVFSQRRLTQFAWGWGQFLDHTFGLRDGGGPTATAFNIPFNANDPMESFTNNLGTIAVNRSAATRGTGTSTSNPRQQTNTITSYISAQAVYGSSPTRLDWLRSGPVDGNPTNNSALLLMSANNYLPAATARGNAATAPAADADGRLAAHPQDRRIAGDPRANENTGLTALHTVFDREHNRIVHLLPNTLSQENKFQIARRVIIAEEQYITYQEWLPAMGIARPRYTGYKNNVNATISNEFATLGYRVHSEIHGEFEIEADAGQYSAAALNQFRAEGLEVDVDATGAGVIAVPAAVSNFNPGLLEQLGLGPMLLSEEEQQYNNDEQIDNQLRSVLFQIPSSQNPECLNGTTVCGVDRLPPPSRVSAIGTSNRTQPNAPLPLPPLPPSPRDGIAVEDRAQVRLGPAVAKVPPAQRHLDQGGLQEVLSQVLVAADEVRGAEQSRLTGLDKRSEVLVRVGPIGGHVTRTYRGPVWLGARVSARQVGY